MLTKLRAKSYQYILAIITNMTKEHFSPLYHDYSHLEKNQIASSFKTNDQSVGLI